MTAWPLDELGAAVADEPELVVDEPELLTPDALEVPDVLEADDEPLVAVGLALDVAEAVVVPDAPEAVWVPEAARSTRLAVAARLEAPAAAVRRRSRRRARARRVRGSEVAGWRWWSMATLCATGLGAPFGRPVRYL